MDPRTEAGRLGEALNTMLGRIEDAVRERAASQDRLRRFVADASHELRTPLTSVRGSTVTRSTWYGRRRPARSTAPSDGASTSSPSWP